MDETIDFNQQSARKVASQFHDKALAQAVYEFHLVMLARKQKEKDNEQPSR